MADEEALLRELEELDKQLNEKKAEVSQRREKVREVALKAAEVRTFTQKEMDNLRSIFNRFDKDGSGSISLQELQTIAAELGSTMSNEEAEAAMKELDANKDNTLNFDEFVRWWSSDSKRGGNKGLLVDVIKAKIIAEMIQKEFATVMRDVSTKPIQLGSSKLDIHIDTVAGDVSSGDFKSNVSLFILPSSRATLEGEFAKASVSSPMAELKPAACVTIDFGIREGVSNEQAGEVASMFDGMLQQFASMSPIPGTQVSLKVIPEERVIRGQAFVFFPAEEQDPFQRMTSDILADDKADAEDFANKALDNFSLSYSFIENLSEYFGYNKKVNLLKPLSGIRGQAHLKFTRSLLDLVEMKSFKKVVTASDDWSSRKKRAQNLVGLFGLQLLEQIDISTHASSISEALEKMIRAICSMPVRLAASLEAENTEAIAEECAKLQEYLLNLTRLTYGSWCVGDILCAAPLPPIPDQAFEMAAQVGRIVNTIPAISVHSPYLAGKITAKNLPWFDFLIGKEEYLANRERVQQRMAELQMEAMKGMELESQLTNVKSLFEKDKEQLTGNLRNVVNVFQVA